MADRRRGLAYFALAAAAIALASDRAQAEQRIYFQGYGCLAYSVALDGSDERCLVPNDILWSSEFVGPVAVDAAHRELFYGLLGRGSHNELTGALISLLMIENAELFTSRAPSLYANVDPPWGCSICSAPLGIALDLAAGKIYWTQNVDPGGCCVLSYGELRRANLDFSQEEILVGGDVLGGVGGIALDLAAGKVLWSTGYSIWRANLDGTDAAIFHEPTDGAGVFHLAIDAAGRRIYWTDGFLGGGTRIQSVDLDGNDERVDHDAAGVDGLAIDASAGFLYWSQPHVVRRSALGSQDVEDVIPRSIAFLTIADAAVRPDYDIAVADDGAAAVVRVDPATWSVTPISSGGRLQSPRGIAVEGNGDLLVADRLAQEIVRIDPATGEQSAASAPGVFEAPVDVAVDDALRIVVADLGAGEVRRLAEDGASAEALPFGPSADGPLGLAVDANGDLYATDGAAATLFHVGESEATPVSAGTPLERPLRATAGADGALYVTDTDANTVLRVDAATGATGAVLAADSFTDPFGITADPNGDLLVLDRLAGRLYRVDPVHGLRRPLTEAGAFEDPRGIAIRPVPEPFALASGLAAAVAIAVLGARRQVVCGVKLLRDV